uniref:Collagen alpha-2(I) chain-like isoform X2 n=1 Tax=Geotrypetes seraphini TaxID=260995 RepID=A0A6P8NLI8_GEOSA|nr:collagen alpha-2(I) chain-like isoform X2 [Geotrypetes seraphini]
MEHSPSISASDLAELSILAGDSLDEGDMAPVGAAASVGRALPPRRSRSVARTAIALEVVGAVSEVWKSAGSARRGRLPGSRARGRASAGRGAVVAFPVDDSGSRVGSQGAGGVPAVLLEDRLGLGAPPLIGGVSDTSGFQGTSVIPSTSGAASGPHGGMAGGWSPWGIWGSPWVMGPWASAPPSFPAVGPPSPWGPGFGGGFSGSEIHGGVASSMGLTYPPAVQVAGPCPDFSPQAVAAGRAAMAGSSSAGPVREGPAGAVRTNVVEPARTTQRPAMVVAADGAASEAVDGGCGPGADRTTGAAAATLGEGSLASQSDDP